MATTKQALLVTILTVTVVLSVVIFLLWTKPMDEACRTACAQQGYDYEAGLFISETQCRCEKVINLP